MCIYISPGISWSTSDARAGVSRPFTSRARAKPQKLINLTRAGGTDDLGKIERLWMSPARVRAHTHV